MFGYNTTSFAQGFAFGAVGAVIELHDMSQQAIAQAKQLDTISRKNTMKFLSQTYTFLLCAESLTQWAVAETLDRVTAAHDFVHRHLTSDEAKAFYQFVQDVCTMVILLGRLAREVMDRYVNECDYTFKAAQELHEFDARLESPAPVEATIEPAVAGVAEVIPSAEPLAAEIDETEPVEDATEAVPQSDLPWTFFGSTVLPLMKEYTIRDLKKMASAYCKANPHARIEGWNVMTKPQLLNELVKRGVVKTA